MIIQTFETLSRPDGRVFPLKMGSLSHEKMSEKMNGMPMRNLGFHKTKTKTKQRNHPKQQQERRFLSTLKKRKEFMEFLAVGFWIGWKPGSRGEVKYDILYYN
jgi:hypothetical protein